MASLGGDWDGAFQRAIPLRGNALIGCNMEGTSPDMGGGGMDHIKMNNIAEMNARNASANER